MEGKKIWMRLGVTVPLTEDELFEIMEENHRECVEAFGKYAREDKMGDYDLSEEQAAKFLKRAVTDGESYIPKVCFDEHIKWWEKERERNLKAMKKNLDGWKLTSLEYDPGTDETYIVCGGNRRYKIPGRWTAETMIYALKKMRVKEETT